METNKTVDLILHRRSLLTGHARMLQDMMAERKVKPDMETRRLLNDIRNAG